MVRTLEYFLLIVVVLVFCRNTSEKKVAVALTAAFIPDFVKTFIKPLPDVPSPEKKYVFLTWDDSPSPEGTLNCMKVFHDQHVKATFFAVGLNIHDHAGQQLVDSLRNSYPEFLLANHSWSHGFRNNYKKFYSSPDSAINDLVHNETFLHIQMKIVRLPSSNSWVGANENKGPMSAVLVRNRLALMGYTAIGWDIEWRPLNKGVRQSARDVARQVFEKFNNGLTNNRNAVVILSHDRFFRSPQYLDSLNTLITILKQDPRIVFETVDHYPLYSDDFAR